MDHSEASRIERVINRELGERFPGPELRAVLLQSDDDPAIEPGQLMVRVFIPAPGARADYEQPVGREREQAPPPAKPLAREGGVFRRFLDGFRYDSEA